jgi:ATP-binding cassette subfamily F protein 3
MIHINKLSVSFGGEYLFNEISFRLTAGDRVGLIGKNGAGKSTMLKILAGDKSSFEGELAKEKGLSIGILRQDIDFTVGNTVLEEAYQAFEELMKLEHQLEEINVQLVERTDYESESYSELINQLSEYQDRYEILGGYNYKGDTERILKGLGFKDEDLDKATETFSGGWRMRIELAKLLLQNNDILLLDEPTNHLDIESIIWLEGFLTSYPGCVVIVSHDKMFLDNVTNRTIELSLGRIYDYPKPYSAFKVLRQELIEQQLNAQKNQQREIDQAERLISKFKAKASKASMAQSLMKKLDRMDRIEVDQVDNAAMKLSFPVSVVPGKVVYEANKASKSFGDKKVLQEVSFYIERNEKVAFVGQNGQGKSTLAKMMVGEHQFDGEIKLGHNVQVGYFAQNQAEYLDGNKTVLDTMIDAANETNRAKVRDILGSFLFRGDDVEKYVKVLSGGERNRLALAKMLLSPFNILIMDEPTNHLDIASKNVLKEALKKFEGTLILVSHDRDFLQGLANKVFEFRDHQVKEFLGGIDDYLKQRSLSDMRQVEQASKTESSKAKSETTAVDYETQKKLKSLKNRLSKVESEINQLERDLKKTDTALQINYDETIKEVNFFEKYQSKKKKLQELMQSWEEVQFQLEALN